MLKRGYRRTLQQSPNFLHNDQKYAYTLKNGVTYANNVPKMVVEPLSFMRGLRFRSRCIMGYHTVMGLSEAA